ncbi:carotenoid biosynthesis protein [Mucilaginibacter defluvii]|uniref:carotenoid biosynthesis protein n=1 Tax=Mucilaginibacter defluvii TaxID=1196019 RepID=UPI0031E6CB14
MAQLNRTDIIAFTALSLDANQHQGLPYGIPPWWCYSIAEVSMFTLFFMCLVHASGKGLRDVMYLTGGLVFGILLEYLEVMLGNYRYGTFALMIGNAPFQVPLCIGAGWGIIMYTARLYTDHIQLPLLGAAAADTLIALCIDISMDVVAYRTHMWHWDWTPMQLNPLTAQWFGIPFGNFVGWQVVVFSYSSLSRYFENRICKRGSWSCSYVWIALISVCCSITVLFFSTGAFHWLSKHVRFLSVHRFIGITLMLFALVVNSWQKRLVPQTSLPKITMWVPGWFHLYFLSCFFVLGFYRENIWMTVAAIANGLTGCVFHLHLRKLTKNVEGLVDHPLPDKKEI